MAGSKSDTLENAILNFLLGAAIPTDFVGTGSYSSSTAWFPPNNVYVGLWTATLSDTSTGATAGEVSTSGTSYARVTVANNTTNWPSTSTGSKSNGTAITFTTATGSWGTVTYFAILDNATAGAGKILYYGDLSASKTIGTGDTASFASSQITVTEN